MPACEMEYGKVSTYWNKQRPSEWFSMSEVSFFPLVRFMRSCEEIPPAIYISHHPLPKPLSQLITPTVSNDDKHQVFRLIAILILILDKIRAGGMASSMLSSAIIAFW